MKESIGTVITNFRLNIVDNDHATGTAEMLVFVYDKDPSKNQSFEVNLIGRLDDQYVRTPVGWRFQSRRLDANLSRNYTSESTVNISVKSDLSVSGRSAANSAPVESNIPLSRGLNYGRVRFGAPCAFWRN